MDINIEELRKVLKAMEDFQVTELQYENLHLKRAVEKALRVETQANPETSVQAEATDDRQEQKGETIPSPVVGVFYSAPGPEQAPLRRCGDLRAQRRTARHFHPWKPAAGPRLGLCGAEQPGRYGHLRDVLGDDERRAGHRSGGEP